MTEEQIKTKAKEQFPNDEFKQQAVIDAINWATRELQKENAELKRHIKADCIDCADYYKNKRLEKENAELRKIAEFQQSSNISRHFENKKLKEGLAVGSTFNKALNSLNKTLEEERDKYRNMVFDKDNQLTKAKELLKRCYDNYIHLEPLRSEIEQFLNSEMEK